MMVIIWSWRLWAYYGCYMMGVMVSRLVARVNGLVALAKMRAWKTVLEVGGSYGRDVWSSYGHGG
jgi:hypothetical protein